MTSFHFILCYVHIVIYSILENGKEGQREKRGTGQQGDSHLKSIDFLFFRLNGLKKISENNSYTVSSLALIINLGAVLLLSLLYFYYL
jgi:hypothetical protein